MDRIKFILPVVMLISVDLFSQGISIRSFVPLINDTDASVNYIRIDQNGDTCAIIKVLTNQKDLSFDGDALGIVEIEERDDCYWLYLPHGVKRLTIMHEKLGILRGYPYPMEIKGARVYQATINTRDVRSSAQSRSFSTQFVTIISQPDSANVFINDIHQGQTPFQMIFPEGEYAFRIVKYNFETASGNFNLSSSERKEISVVMDSASVFSADEPASLLMKVTIESDPSIAQIYIDDEYRGITPSIIPITTGSHQIRLLKEGSSYEGQIDITPGGKIAWTFRLNEENSTGNIRSGKIRKVKSQPSTFFTSIIYGTQGFNVRNGGLMIGNVSTWGWFIQLEYYTTSARNQIRYNYDGLKLSDYDGNGYYIFDNKLSNYRIGGTMGIVKKIDLMNIYIGCGYGRSDIFWHIIEYDPKYIITSEAWVKNLDRSIHGLELSTGLMLNANKFNFIIGVNTLSFKAYEAKFGLGISW